MNSFYNKVSRTVCWFLIPATLGVGGLAAAAAFPAAPESGTASWNQETVRPVQRVQTIEAPALHPVIEVPTVEIKAVPPIRTAPKPATVDCSNAKIKTREDLGGGSSVLYCHN